MKNKFRRYIRTHPWTEWLIDQMESFHIGSKVKIPLYSFLKIIYVNSTNNSLHTKANAVAFSFTLSLFPGLLFLLALIPYTPIDQQEVLQFLKDSIPREIFKIVDSTISDIVNNKRQDLLSFGILFSLYAATNGMAALIDGFNSTFRYAEKRNFIQLRLTALLLTFLLGFTFFFAIIALIVSRFVLNWLLQEGFLSDDLFYLGILIIKYIIVFSVFFVAISLIYYIAPASHQRWRFFSIGSIVASILIILVTNAFSFYLDNFANYNRVYGSIGAVIAMMVWIYFLCFLLMFGFELNAAWMEAKKVHLQEQPTTTV